MEMETEPVYGTAGGQDAGGHVAAVSTNPFILAQEQSGFLVQSQEPVDGQASSGGFGAAIPPGVAASVGVQQGASPITRTFHACGPNRPF